MLLHIGTVVVTTALCLASSPLHASSPWTGTVQGEQGVPGGWVQVRENSIAGTRLHLAGDLGVHHLRRVRLGLARRLSSNASLRLSVSSASLTGSAVVTRPLTFNGTTVAPGRLRTITRFPDLLAFAAAYRRRLLRFGRGGTLWGGVGLHYVMLNFRMAGPIAADSRGHELKEDFYVQELPVPMLGLHLRYPLGAWAQLRLDARYSMLPWVDSLRSEGGEVRLTQRERDLRLGVRDRVGRHWRLGAYLFDRRFSQHERSREDGNAVVLSSHGFGIDVGYRFRP